MKVKGLKIILSEKDNSSTEDFDKVLRTFKKQVRKFGIIKEVRERMSFVKPSEKLRLKRLKRKRK